MMKIRHSLLCIALIALTSELSAEISPLPTLTMKLEESPNDPFRGIGSLQSPFYFVIKDGEAFLSQDENPKRDSEKRKGIVDFVMRNGIDPSTKTAKDPILYMLFRHDTSGWADDRIITELQVPFSKPPHSRDDRRKAPHPIGVIQFSDQATITMSWVIESQASIRVIGDPMGVRYVQTLKCTVVSSNLQVPSMSR